jgi:hypothetical protein
MSSWTECLHPLTEEVVDEKEGDVICSACGVIKEERGAYMGHRPSESRDECTRHSSLQTPPSDIPYRVAMSEACQLLGLPTAELLVDECMDTFAQYCSALSQSADGPKTFPTKLPILAYAFQRVLARNGIFRLTHVYAGLFNIRPRRLLQAENAVCEALSLSPLYIAPSSLIETVCRWLHLKPALVLVCADLCRRVEPLHYGKAPEWIIYSVMNVISLRLTVLHPNYATPICMEEVRSLLNIGTRLRKVPVSNEWADEELRRRPLV